MNGIVTLTTDFGLRDPYVAAMKGVILRIVPRATLLDLSHDIRPGGIMEGALFLAAAIPHFPSGTAHVAVIDPGVGTQRKALVVTVLGQILVMPDNGLVTMLAKRHSIAEVREIENKALMRDAISTTFQGRDVLAPVAAHLAAGTPLADVGPAIDTWVELPWEEPTCDPAGVLHGTVVHVDRFGNAITNIPDTMLNAATALVAIACNHPFPLRRTYGDVEPGQSLAVIGSTGHLELSLNGAHAANALGIGEGTQVSIEAEP